MARWRRSRSDSARPLAGGTRSARADGVGAAWVNPTTGLGSELDGETGTWWDGGCPLDYTQASELVRTNALARRIASQEAKVSLKEGIIVKGMLNGAPLNVRVGGKPEEKDEEPDPLAVWTKRFGLFRLVRQARSQAYAHGSTMWVFGVDDGRRTDEPLDIGQVRRLLWVKVITGGASGRVSVSRWGRDPLAPRFEQPTHYWVTFSRSGMMVEYHWTRLHQWIGVDLPDEEREQLHDYGGGSILDLVWTGLKGYGVSIQRMLAALGLLSQGVWKNADLARAVDAGNSKKVAAHYERMRLGGGQFGDYVLAEGESYAVVGRPMAGIPESIDRSQAALVADGGMGEAVTLGAQPSLSGLNNDADAGIKAYLNEVASLWEETYADPIAMFYAIASRALNGPTRGVPIIGLEVQQPSLWSLTPEEAAAVRGSNATARSTDIAAGVISVAEARTDSTLGDEYELAPEPVAAVGEEEVASVEDIEVADDDLMPNGETPLDLTKARAILGRKSNGGALGDIKRMGVPLFRPNGVNYRVFESHLRAAMRESQVV